jgi:hypothetical protein
MSDERVARPVAVGPKAEAPSWVDRALEACDGASRLADDQPPSGLLWVVTGSVVVREGKRDPREAVRGSVVSYRLGPDLAWTATAGTKVRWSERPVALEAGRVDTWTSDLVAESFGVPDAVKPPPPKRSTLVVGVLGLWAVAITLAWCYKSTMASREKASAADLGQRVRETEPKANADLKAVVVETIRGRGFKAVQATARRKESGTHVTVAVSGHAVPPADGDASDDFPDLVSALPPVFGSNVTLASVEVVLLDSDAANADALASYRFARDGSVSRR